jgi:hypothetical protein
MNCHGSWYKQQPDINRRPGYSQIEVGQTATISFPSGVIEGKVVYVETLSRRRLITIEGQEDEFFYFRENGHYGFDEVYENLNTGHWHHMYSGAQVDFGVLVDG